MRYEKCNNNDGLLQAAVEGGEWRVLGGTFHRLTPTAGRPSPLLHSRRRPRHWMAATPPVPFPVPVAVRLLLTHAPCWPSEGAIAGLGWARIRTLRDGSHDFHSSPSVAFLILFSSPISVCLWKTPSTPLQNHRLLAGPTSACPSLLESATDDFYELRPRSLVFQHSVFCSATASKQLLRHPRPISINSIILRSYHTLIVLQIRRASLIVTKNFRITLHIPSSKST